MNNSKENFKPKNDFLEGLTELIEQSPEKFFFLKAFMEALVNKEPISVSLSLNSDLHTVKVRMKEYIYEEDFGTLEAAEEFISIVKCADKEVA